MSTYLKYAIGEIVLVVLGILIALQINNWNQNRKRLQLEQVLLEQIKDEMLSQYWDIKMDLEFLRMGERAYFKALDHMESEQPYSDSLCFYFGLLKADEYIYPSEAVYSKIKAEGLDILRTDFIRMGIQDLYETDYPRISRDKSFTPDISEYLDEYYSENFKPNTNYNLKFSVTFPGDTLAGIEVPDRTIDFPGEFEINGKSRPFSVGYVPRDYEFLKSDTKFRMLLDQADTYRGYKIQRYERAKQAIRRLVTAIDSTLAQ